MLQGRNVIKNFPCAFAPLRQNKAMKILASLTLFLALLLVAACALESPATAPPAVPTAAQNLGATVEAAVSAALLTETPTPPPDIDATVAAGIEATQAAAPTLTPTPPPTPDVDATVEARMAATVAARPTPTPTPDPTATPVPTPTPTLTPTPTATPTPTPLPTATPRPTPRPRPTATPTTPPAARFSEMVRQARTAVVKVESAAGVGSGVIFDTLNNSAYVLTNHHVVKFVAEAKVNVVIRESTTYTYNGTVLGTDPIHDLAIVEICCGSFSTLPFGDTSALEPGDEVFTVGYDLELSGEPTVARSVVSAISHAPHYQSDVIQTDTTINPGNSGGPMLSMTGEILGINTFRRSETDISLPVEVDAFAISGLTAQQQIPILKAVPPSGESVAKVFAPISGSLYSVAWYNKTTHQWQAYAPYGNFSLVDFLERYELDVSSTGTLTHVSVGDIVWLDVSENVRFQGLSLTKGFNLIALR